jgi:hypothetical protein
MSIPKFLAFILLSISVTRIPAQHIVYSEPQKDDTRRTDFEIAGKINGNFLIYKNNRTNRHIISVYDNDMQEVSHVEEDFLPSSERMINIDFFPYNDFCYLIYEYQKKNIVYCMGAAIDGHANLIGSPKVLDTTRLGFAANNKIYNAVISEDKSKFVIFKINNKNRELYKLTTLLLNDKLDSLSLARFEIPMVDHTDLLNNFNVDNDGNFIFTKISRTLNEDIKAASMQLVPAGSQTLTQRDLTLDKIMLDELQLKIDNFNKRYYLVSYYLNEHRGNIDGLYFYVWDYKGQKEYLENKYPFPDDYRREAKGDASVKSAFNDYFIRTITLRKDGGFIISNESYYTTSRFNNWNRWEYLNGAYYNPYTTYNYYSYMSPYYAGMYNPYYWNSSRSNNNQSVRFHADNVAVISFSNKGEAEWKNVIGKTQFDDQSDDFISYQLLNAGDQLHFLFNNQERKNNLLNDYSVNANGDLTHNPTLKNLDRGYDFMPRYGKQVSARQMIIPCQYRNYLCFAKIDYN